MIDIPLYMFANLVFTDAVNYQKYEKGFFPLLKKSGGRIIPSCFPSEEVSRNWFTDADYQALSN